MQTRYGYDAFGNRVLKEERTGPTLYRHNALNQLVAETKNGLEKTYRYDKRGNLTLIMENGQTIQQYVYGALNRLEEAVDQAGKAAKYQYNGLGHRVGKLEGSLPAARMEQMEKHLNPQSRIDMEIGNQRQISYTIDLTREYHNLLERSEGDSTQTYFWDGNVASYEENGQRSFYLQDELGSPLRIEDEIGRTRESYGYGAFGEDLYGNQGELQPFGYTGYQKDRVAGTYYAQAREYQPSIGRFNSEDIIGGFILFPDTLNHYIYCWNNSLLYIDNDGEFPTIAIGAGIGALIGGIGSVISDVSKGKEIDWTKAAKNALKGGAAGALIGTGVGAVGALSATGASTVAVNTAIAATAGASYRAGSDIVNSIRSGEMTISSPLRYLTSAASGVMLYHSNRLYPAATKLGLVVQGASDIVAGDLSSLETYAGAGVSTALIAKFAESPSIIQALITGAGTDLTQLLEQIGGVKRYSAIDYIVGPAKNILIGAFAKFLTYKFPNRLVEEDEFTALIDGLLRRIEGVCSE